jgi:hypothetical protein
MYFRYFAVLAKDQHLGVSAAHAGFVLHSDAVAWAEANSTASASYVVLYSEGEGE